MTGSIRRRRSLMATATVGVLWFSLVGCGSETKVATPPTTTISPPSPGGYGAGVVDVAPPTTSAGPNPNRRKIPGLPDATTVPQPTSPPATQPAAQNPADTCDVDHLAEAVQAKEGFDPRATGLEPPGVLGIECVEDWAMADVDRPQVGTTDGATLFHWVDGTWSEVDQVGWPPAGCRLVEMGVPTDIALQLMEGDPEDERQACVEMGLPPIT